DPRGHGQLGPRARARGRDRREDRHDQRGPRRVVRRLLLAARRRGLGRLRRRPAPRPVRRGGGAAHLVALHEAGPRRVPRGGLPRPRRDHDGQHRRDQRQARRRRVSPRRARDLPPRHRARAVRGAPRHHPAGAEPVAALPRLAAALGRRPARVPWLLALALAVGAAGCAPSGGRSVARPPVAKTPAPSTSKTPPPPTSNPPIVGSEETGEASWYGLRHHGHTTASGEAYDMNALTAAHPTL